MLKIKPIRGALALLLAVLLCLAMSLTAFLIDTPAMREHAEQAVDLLGYESASPEIVGGFASSRLDNYTAVLILKTAAYIGDDPLLRMAFSGLRTDLPRRRIKPIGRLTPPIRTRFPPRTTFHTAAIGTATRSRSGCCSACSPSPTCKCSFSLCRRRCSFGRCC